MLRQVLRRIRRVDLVPRKIVEIDVGRSLQQIRILIISIRYKPIIIPNIRRTIPAATKIRVIMMIAIGIVRIIPLST